MAGQGKPKKRKKIRERDVGGLKYFDKLAPLLARLHEVGTERDRAGNRKLHMDQYCLLVLLFLFNPIVTSLRAIQQASELKKVQKRLNCPRTSLGSLSEATDVFDPQRLLPIIEELRDQLRPIQRDPRLQDVKHILTAVDGSLIKTLSKIAQAAYLKSPSSGRSLSAWRLHTQFEIERHVPTRIDVTGGSNSGEQDERHVLAANLQSDRCYIMDRGYALFALFNAIHDIGSSYVCRVRDNSSYNILQERPLSPEALEADITADYLIKPTYKDARLNHPFRLVMVKIKPHVSRGKRGGGTTGQSSDGYLRIVTNLVDVPAEIISLIYQYRWTIEVFFASSSTC
jgi:hypothetical protein